MKIRRTMAGACAVVLAAGIAGAAVAQRLDGRYYGNDEGGRYNRGGNSWYGAPRSYAPQNGAWAVGTFYGANGANGEPETLTIQPDGSAELRTRGKAPEYGTFAGETLTVGSRISKVQPARGGIVIDGSYYRR